jgi:hypothetical protein
MAITVTVTESPTYITVDETNLTVTLNQSDNPITITTTSDLTLQAGAASDPSGSNLAEGDLWYNTSSEELFVYREISTSVYEWHTIASAGGSSPTSFTLDGGSF